jgi:2-iminoacetate synthase
MESFWKFIEQTDHEALKKRIDAVTDAEVQRALGHETIAPEAIPALFSEAAVPYLEQMAQRAHALTERRFGRVKNLYVPLYITNECVNKCTYCGFAHDLPIPRLTLSLERTVKEAQILHDEGFRHLLLVAGESRRHLTIPQLAEIVQRVRPLFASVSIEIQTLNYEEYCELIAAGIDGLTIFQETYDPVRYKEVHKAGPKRIMHRRIEAFEAGGEAGMRTIGIGTLLGLNPWRYEATMLALHGRYLTKRFWKSRVAVNFPRIREAAGDYQPDYPVRDRDLVQMICAMRLILPDAELVVSTREPAALRDRLIHLGVNRLSAGSKTNPGGYETPSEGGEQFEVVDPRSPAEVAQMIAAAGYEPVWKDFDCEFAGVSQPVA